MSKKILNHLIYTVAKRNFFNLFQSFFFSLSKKSEVEECGVAQMLSWSNLTVSEGGTAIYRCPLDTATSCLVDLVEWFQVNPDGTRKLLRDSRVEVFAFDPLLM